MLSAQKEQIRQALTVISEDLPNVGSFGKVVNSIQGLQQRLESFSADDVGAAHDRTQTLLLRLADLQRKLTDFVAIKESLAAVRVSVEQMLTDCVDPLKLEPLNQPLRIQSLIQANKLIQFPRLNKLVTDANASPLGADPMPVAASISDDDLAEPREVSEHVEQAADNELLQEIAHPISDAPPESGEVLTATSPEQGNSAEDSPLQTTPQAWSAATLDSAAAVDPTAREAEVREDHGYDAQPPSSIPIDESSASVIQHEPTEASAVKAGTEFDQELLDDLIKNYGEFAAALGSTRTPDTQEVATDNSALGVPDPPQAADAVVERNNLPEVKKQDDIDRQLKKIIKDYGEYDLYSRQGPVNLKTGVIAAFLLLALILSGFYYFSPANSQNSPAPSAATIHPSGSGEGKEGDNNASPPAMPAGDTGVLRGADINSRPKNRK